MRATARAVGSTSPAMSERTVHLSEEEFEELEHEAMRVGTLPAAEQRAALAALIDRFPAHVDMIEALVGIVASDDEAARIERVGSYRIERKLGEGGMGHVFLARRSGAHHDVALKVVRPDVESREVFRRFEREATVLRELQHESIARFLESGEADVVYHGGVTTRSPFLAMEFVDGPTLREFAATETLELRARVELIAQVCEGVAHAHARGIVHRDLKPGNILVDRKDGRATPKVLDFGIARAADSESLHTLTRTGRDGLLGTALYMSPEQIAHGAKDLGRPSDVYSLGVVLFEILTGQLPYPVAGRSLPEVARVITEEDPTKLRRFGDDLRGDLEWIVGKALEKPPALRYTDAGQLAADLRRYLAGEPVTAHRPGVLRRAARFSRRHKVLVGIMAALVVGTISTAIFAWSAELARREAEATAYRANLSAAVYSIERYDTTTAARHVELAAQAASADAFELQHLRSRLEDSLVRLDLGDAHGVDLECSADGRRVFALWQDRDARSADVVGWRLATIDVVSGELLAGRDLDADSAHVLAGGRLCRVYPGFASEPLEPSIRPTRFAAERDEYTLPSAPSPGAPFVAVHLDGRGLVERGESIQRFRIHDDVQAPIAIGPDAAWLVSQRHTALTWWRLADGEKPVPVTMVRADDQPVRSMAVSADGRWLATGGEDGYLEIWRATRDAAPERYRRLNGHRDAVEAVEFSPDGRLLASAGEDLAVRIWNFETGDLLMEGLGHRAGVRALAFADAGRRLVSAGRDAIRVWSTSGGLRRFPHRAPAVFGLMRDALLVSGDYAGHLTLRDTRSSALLAEWRPAWLPTGAQLTSVASDGKRLAVGINHVDANGVVVLDLDTGRVAARLPRGERSAMGWNVAMSPDGTYLAGHGGDRGVHVWATDDWRLVARTEIEDPSRLLVFSHDGTRLATGGRDGAVVIRRVTDLGVRRTLAADDDRPPPKRGAFGPGDRTFASTHGDTIRAWDLATGTERLHLRTPGVDAYCVAISHDGTRIASGGANGTVHVWDTTSGSPIVSFRQHRDWVASIAFGVDDRALFTGSADGDVRVWDTEPLAVRAAAARERDLVVERLRDREPVTPREREVARQLELARRFGK